MTDITEGEKTIETIIAAEVENLDAVIKEIAGDVWRFYPEDHEEIEKQFSALLGKTFWKRIADDLPEVEVPTFELDSPPDESTT